MSSFSSVLSILSLLSLISNFTLYSLRKRKLSEQNFYQDSYTPGIPMLIFSPFLQIPQMNHLYSQLTPSTTLVHQISASLSSELQLISFLFASSDFFLYWMIIISIQTCCQSFYLKRTLAWLDFYLQLIPYLFFPIDSEAPQQNFLIFPHSAITLALCMYSCEPI